MSSGKLLCILAVCVLGGCSSEQSRAILGIGPLPRYPQSTEVALANPLKLKIERCYWTKSVNLLDDYDSINRPPAAMPSVTTEARDMFLVVELAMTNYGNQPLTPNTPPVFQVVNERGQTFQKEQRFVDMTSKTAFRQGVNPNQVLKAREIFDVSKGPYELQVSEGQYVGSGLATGKALWLWQLSPTDGK